VESAALVAVTVHEPAEVNERVLPETEQPAVPAETSEKVTAPEPEPPVVVRARLEP
jgi:hypothetical protein